MVVANLLTLPKIYEVSIVKWIENSWKADLFTTQFRRVITHTSYDNNMHFLVYGTL